MRCQQSTQLTADNRKQLEIGTLAPLDVVNSDSAVATDKQALITSQSNLEFQQLLMKQADRAQSQRSAARLRSGCSKRSRRARQAARRGHAGGAARDAGVHR